MPATTFTEDPDVQNAPLEDLFYESPSFTPSKPPSIDSGVDEEDIAKDEKNTSRICNDFTNSDCKAQEVHEATLMVHITKETCRLTLIPENGTLQPYIRDNNSAPSTESNCVPLKVAIVRQNVLVFGDQVNLYEGAGPDKAEFLQKNLVSFNIGKLLFDRKSTPLKLYFDDHIIHGKVELLMALFLTHLKIIGKKFLKSSAPIISYNLNKILIMAPLSLRSFHRQRLRDSAQIAGFDTICIINEYDTQTLIRLAAVRHIPRKLVEDSAALTRTEECKRSDQTHAILLQTQAVTNNCRLKVTSKVSKDCNGKYIARLGYPMEQAAFYEQTALGEMCEVGTLQVKPLLYYDHTLAPFVEIHFIQNEEGIFSLESVECTNLATNCKHKLDSKLNEYTWSPANLGRREKQELYEKLKEMFHCSDAYQKIQKELRNVWNDMEDKLWTGKHNELGKERKMKIQKKLERTSRLLNKVSSSQLMEVGKSELQNSLRGLRQDYDMYFDK